MRSRAARMIGQGEEIERQTTAHHEDDHYSGCDLAQQFSMNLHTRGAPFLGRPLRRAG